MFLFAVFAINIVSCSNGEEGTNAEFIEVEIDGVKHTRPIDIHMNIRIDKTLDIWQAYIEINEQNREDFDLIFAHYNRMSELANCKAGVYSVEEHYGYENFDLELGYNVGGRNYGIQKYNHIVTLIKRSGNSVIVEGEFTGNIKTLDKSINGRYRIALDDLIVDTDKQFTDRYNKEND